MIRCFPPYFKYLVLRTLGFILFILIIVSNNYFLIIFLIITTYFESKIYCPKCHHIVGRSKNEVIMIFSDEVCKKCGQNLEKCEIEPDEITTQRLK